MATDDASTPPTENAPPRRVRWWPAVAALGIGAALQSAGVIFFGENRPYLDWACVFVIWPLTVFLLLLWWAFWSRLPWRIRGLGLLVIAVSGGSSLAALRFDEFDGGMIPRFSPRWRPSKKDRAAEFFQTAAANIASSGPHDFANESLVPTAGDWPAFRGPNRDDVVIGESLRTDWDAKPPKQLWKQPIGSGWGAFAVIGRRAWTLEQRGEIVPSLHVGKERREGERAVVRLAELRFDLLPDFDRTAGIAELVRENPRDAHAIRSCIGPRGGLCAIAEHRDELRVALGSF